MGRLEAPRILLSQAQRFSFIPSIPTNHTEAGGDDSLGGQTINADLPGTLDPGSSHNLVRLGVDLLGDDFLALLLMEIHRDVSEGDDRNRYPCEKL